MGIGNVRYQGGGFGALNVHFYIVSVSYRGMTWNILSFLLILYGEAETYGEDAVYGEGRYSEGGADQSGGDQYGVDALLDGSNVETDWYVALLDGESVYLDSAGEYEQHCYDGNLTGDYRFPDQPIPNQCMDEPSYPRATV